MRGFRKFFSRLRRSCLRRVGRPTKLLVAPEKKPLVLRVPRPETEPVGFSNVHSFCFIRTMFDGSISKDFTRNSTKDT